MSGVTETGQSGQSKGRARAERPALPTASSSDDAGPMPSSTVFSPSPCQDLCLAWGASCPWLHCHHHRGPCCVTEDPRDLGVGETVFSFLRLAVRVSQKTDLGGSTEPKMQSSGPPRPCPVCSFLPGVTSWNAAFLILQKRKVWLTRRAAANNRATLFKVAKRTPSRDTPAW